MITPPLDKRYKPLPKDMYKKGEFLHYECQDPSAILDDDSGRNFFSLLCAGEDTLGKRHSIDCDLWRNEIRGLCLLFLVLKISYFNDVGTLLQLAEQYFLKITQLIVLFWTTRTQSLFTLSFFDYTTSLP